MSCERHWETGTDTGPVGRSWGAGVASPDGYANPGDSKKTQLIYAEAGVLSASEAVYALAGLLRTRVCIGERMKQAGAKQNLDRTWLLGDGPKAPYLLPLSV